MSPNELFLLGLGALGLVLALVAYCSIRRRGHELSSLHVPLRPDATDDRSDATQRLASQAPAICAGCGFENVRASAICCLCGQSLEATQGGDTYVGDPRRQRRARMRSEWSRKRDIEGHYFWYRAPTANSAAHGSSGAPGHVLRFVASKRTVPVHVPHNTPSAQPSTHHARASLSCAEVEEPQVLLADIASALQRELEETDLRVADAGIADPTEFATATTAAMVLEATGQSLSTDELIEINNNSNFPTKLATFVTQTSALAASSEQTTKLIPCSRQNLLHDSIFFMATLSPLHARAPMRVQFIGEQGIKLILGLPVTFDDLEFYDREMHRSLRWLLEHDGVEALGLDFTVCEEEMEGEDENEDKWEKEDDDKGGDAVEDDNAAGNADVGPGVNHGPAPSGASGFDGHFGDGDGAGGAFAAVGSRMRRRRRHRMRVVELIPNGHDVAVTDANKHEYVERKLRYVLFERVSRQLFAFVRGVYDVIPPALLMLLDAEELDVVLAGSDAIDVGDWERHATHSPNLWEHPVRRWFWELVREMPNEYRRRLLQFATGCSRVPLSGFAALTSFDGRLCPFTLQGVPLHGDRGYIRSHACFNRLDLPLYRTKARLRGVLHGILTTEVFGFTTD